MIRNQKGMSLISSILGAGIGLGVIMSVMELGGNLKGFKKSVKASTTLYQKAITVGSLLEDSDMCMDVIKQKLGANPRFVPGDTGIDLDDIQINGNSVLKEGDRFLNYTLSSMNLKLDQDLGVVNGYHRYVLGLHLSFSTSSSSNPVKNYYQGKVILLTEDLTGNIIRCSPQFSDGSTARTQCESIGGTFDLGTNECEVSCSAGEYLQEIKSGGKVCVTHPARICPAGTISNGTGLQTYDGVNWSPCQVSVCNVGYSKSGNTCVASGGGGGSSGGGSKPTKQYRWVYIGPNKKFPCHPSPAPVPSCPFSSPTNNVACNSRKKGNTCWVYTGVRLMGGRGSCAGKYYKKYRCQQI